MKFPEAVAIWRQRTGSKQPYVRKGSPAYAEVMAILKEKGPEPVLKGHLSVVPESEPPVVSDLMFITILGQPYAVELASRKIYDDDAEYVGKFMPEYILYPILLDDEDTPLNSFLKLHIGEAVPEAHRRPVYEPIYKKATQMGPKLTGIVRALHKQRTGKLPDTNTFREEYRSILDEKADALFRKLISQDDKRQAAKEKEQRKIEMEIRMGMRDKSGKLLEE